ncbi:WD40 repeat [Modicisalibacter ilicicola DSM 19980]|uniref:WD40 repeat n=1 Tax=Modicisalibacter ilicicola DSM 19980 TaxID=1121942 RepID=A0A1M4W0L2_9GAMM|nr:TIR domain-containing protein [Halomonas ilicicola]SHE74737.1 WD40 repeat [Halomonas ilicicola DSM 19980]
MSTLFISHSSADAQAAAELTAWLERQGHHSLFLDFDVEHGIPAGHDWERELYRRLRTCQAMIVLCSPAAMASCWCLAELSHARALGKRILPVRIAPCTLRPQLAELQVIDLVKEPETGYTRLHRALASVFAWDSRRPPYPGLMAFDEQDAAIFFGRDDEIQQALDRLHQLRRFGGPRLLMLLGASGSGKSSLVRAGLLPRLRAAPESWAVVGPFRPQDRPFEELTRCLARDLARAGLPAKRTAALMAAEKTRALTMLARELQGLPDREHATLVLFIDQLEELLTETAAAERVMQWLCPALEADASLMVIATLRSDFLGALQAHRAWRDVVFEPLTVEPLSVAGFAAVIEGPAELAGLELETGLVPAMVADTVTQDALPLLAFTLRELWERGGQQGRLTLAEYRDGLGGLSGSVARVAEAVMAAAAPDRQEEQALRSALLALVSLDEQGRYTRQTVRWEALPGASHPLLERFVAARLLIAAHQDGARTLEIAHEALLRVWRRFTDWLEASREALRVHAGLRRAAGEWGAGGRSVELLVHRGNRLAMAEALAEEGLIPLDTIARDYLQACRASRDAELAESRRRKQVKRRWIATTGVILLIAVASLSWLSLSLHRQSQVTRQGLADLHWTNGVRARDRDVDLLKASHHFMQVAELALAPARAASAYWAGRRLGEGPRLLAATDGLAGLTMADFDDEGVRLWLYGNDRLWTEAQPEVAGGRQQVQTASPGGRPWRSRIAVYDGEGRVGIRERRSATLLVETPPGVERLWIGGRDETIAVSAHADGDAWVWDLSRGERLGALPGAAPIAGVAIAPEGERVLAWTQQRTALLWETASASTVIDYDGGIVGGALGDQEQQVVLWRRDGRLWLPAMPAMRLEPAPGGRCSGRAIGARFLAGDRLLVWNHGACGSARLWDLATRQPVGPVLRHRNELAPPAVRGDRIVTWSLDQGPARLWNGTTGALLATLPGPVLGSRFGGGDTRLITWGGNDARLWSSVTGEPLGLPMRHPAMVRGAMVSDDGQHLISWDAEGSLRRWQAPPSAPVARIRLPGEVLDAVLEPDEAQVRLVTLDGHVRSWSPATAAPPASQRLDPRTVQASFAPRGRRLFTATPSGKVRLWNLEGSAFELLAAPGGAPEESPVAAMVWSRDADRLLFWGEQGCTAWLWRVGMARLMPVAHDAPPEGDGGCRLRGAVFVAEGSRLLTWGEDRYLRSWDIASAEPVPSDLLVTSALLRSVEVDARGERLLTSLANGDVVLSRLDGSGTDLTLRHADVQGASLHRGTLRILSWGGDKVRLWDAETGTLLAALIHEPGLAGAAFAADGERVISWQADGALRLWDAASGQPLTPVLAGVGSSPPIVDSDVGDVTGRVLIVQGDQARLWQWPPFTVPPERPVQRQMLLTGSHLTALGEVEALPATTWQRLAAELDGARPDEARESLSK